LRMLHSSPTRRSSDLPYTVTAVTDGKTPLKYERKGGTIEIWFPFTKQAGESVTTSVTYSGTPRIAPNPPWVGGFMWEKTPSGARSEEHTSELQSRENL